MTKSRLSSKLEENICFSSYSAYTCSEWPSACLNSSMFFFLYNLPWWRIRRTKGCVLEISHCDVKEASVCDLCNTWDDRLCEVHHCPVTHELWLLVCSVRSPIALNCVSRWKPTLSTACPLQTAAVAYLLQAWSRALGLFFFYSFFLTILHYV